MSGNCSLQQLYKAISVSLYTAGYASTLTIHHFLTTFASLSNNPHHKAICHQNEFLMWTNNEWNHKMELDKNFGYDYQCAYAFGRSYNWVGSFLLWCDCVGVRLKVGGSLSVLDHLMCGSCEGYGRVTEFLQVEELHTHNLNKKMNNNRGRISRNLSSLLHWIWEDVSSWGKLCLQSSCIYTCNF